MAETYYDATNLDAILPSRYAERPDTSLHGFGRVAAQAQNFPKRAVASLGGMLEAGADLLTGTTPEFRASRARLRQTGDRDFLYREKEVGRSAGFTDTLTDVAGHIAPELPALLLPGGAVTKGARLMGMGRAAPVVGDVAAGALSGLRDSPGEAGLQAGEFGTMGAVGAALPQRFRPLLRATAEGVAGYGVGVAGQALRGHDPFTMEAQTQAGVMGVLPFAQQAGRRLLGRGPAEPSVSTRSEMPPPAEPGGSVGGGTGIPADWKLRNKVPREAGGFDYVYDTPAGEVRFANAEDFGGGVRRPISAPREETGPILVAERGDVFGNVQKRPQPAAEGGETNPIRDLAEQAGVKYDGPIEIPGGAHQFTDPRTGGTFVVRGDFTPQKFAEKMDAQNMRFGKLRPLGGGAEGGFIDRPVLQSLAGGSIGATVGYALPGTDKEKRNRAIMLGLGGAALPMGRKLFRGLRSEGAAEASAKVMRGESQPAGAKATGATRRFLERNFKLGRSQNLDTAQQQAQNFPERVQSDVMAAGRAAVADLRSLTPSQRDAVNIYMSSDRGGGAKAILDAAGLPKTVSDFLATAQGGKAELQAIVAEALRGTAKGDQMRDTLGTWMYQPYAAYHSPENWNPTKADIDTLVAESRGRAEYKGIGDDLIRKDIEAAMREIKNKGFEQANIPGNKISQRLFTEKKKLSPAYRKFLGEITDPIQREIASIGRLTKAAQTSKLINELPNLRDEQGRAFQMPRSEWQAAIDDAVAKGDIQTASFLRNEWETVPDDPALGKLAKKGGTGEGMMVQRQVLDAMGVGKGHQISDWGKTIFGWFSAAQRPAKAAFTLYNPGTHLHNIAQAPFQAITAGVNPVAFFRNLSELGENRQWLKWAREDGMLDAHVGASEFKRGARDWERITDPTAMDKVRNFHEGVKNLYGKPDQWTRGAAYVGFLKEGLNKLGMAPKQARAYATEMTNRYTQNYSNVSRAVSGLRNVPFVNPFISYTAEMSRIIKNLAEDILTDPMKAKYGVSQRIKAMGKLAVLFGAGVIIKQLAEGGARMFGLTEEDQQRLANMVPNLPPYQQGKTMAGIGFDQKRGTGKFLNLNPWLPAEDFVTMAKNIAAGDVEALAVNNPILSGRSPIISAATEMMTGRDPFTGKESSGYERWVEPVIQNYSPPMAPWGYTGQKLRRAFTTNAEGEFGYTDTQGRRETPGTALLSTAGVSVSQVNERTLLRRKKEQQEAEAREAKTKLNRILRTDVNQATKDAARAEYQEERRRIFGR